MHIFGTKNFALLGVMLSFAFSSPAYSQPKKDILNEVGTLFQHSSVQTKKQTSIAFAFSSQADGIANWIYDQKLVSIPAVIVEKGSHAGISYRQLTKIGKNISCAKWEFSNGAQPGYTCSVEIDRDHSGKFSDTQCGKIPGFCLAGDEESSATYVGHGRTDLIFPLAGHGVFEPAVQIQKEVAVELFKQMENVKTSQKTITDPDGRTYVTYSRQGENLICDFIPAHHNYKDFGICMMVFSSQADGSFMKMTEVFPGVL